ncbi:MAG: lptD 2 [Firmicutes bacterium]|nr:lptD 2 [Bacillota bacterium]
MQKAVGTKAITDDSSTDKYRYDATLTTKWSPKYSTLLGYHYVSDTTSLFSYDTADMNRELDLGIKWQIDRMNGFGILERYDVDKNRIYDLDYTWYRNLHCFEGSITYRAKRDSWKMDVSLLHF